jgi:uncharacterized protein (DUF488 family)
MTVNIFTIGFTKKSAQEFFTQLKEAGVKRVVDVRLNNVSQLAGFSKRDDLKYFLKEIADIDYVHPAELAPTQAMLDAAKKTKNGWPEYEQKFLALMKDRQIEKSVTEEMIADSCLLCSEDKPHHCHRRLVAEYLKEQWGDAEIRHLGQ